jgi:hypothetical protein
MAYTILIVDDDRGVRDLDDLRCIVAHAQGRPVYATLNAPSYPAARCRGWLNSVGCCSMRSEWPH